MSTLLKLFRYSFFLFVAFITLLQATTYGYTSDVKGHSNQTQNATSVAAHSQTDCENACSQTSRDVGTAVVLKETKNKLEKQPQPETKYSKNETRMDSPVKISVSGNYLLATTEIYKLTCAYLF